MGLRQQCCHGSRFPNEAGVDCGGNAAPHTPNNGHGKSCTVHGSKDESSTNGDAAQVGSHSGF